MLSIFFAMAIISRQCIISKIISVYIYIDKIYNIDGYCIVLHDISWCCEGEHQLNQTSPYHFCPSVTPNLGTRLQNLRIRRDSVLGINWNFPRTHFWPEETHFYAFLTTKLGTMNYQSTMSTMQIVLVTSRSAFSLISPELALWNHSRSASESWLYGRPQLGMLGLRRHGLSPSEGSIRVTVELL